jgi:hypothetical protein
MNGIGEWVVSIAIEVMELFIFKARLSLELS